MLTEQEKQAGLERFRRAVKNAQKILKPGDKVRVQRCCRRKSTITFVGWDGSCMISKSGEKDYSPGCVDLLNGQPVDFSQDAKNAGDPPTINSTEANQ